VFYIFQMVLSRGRELTLRWAGRSFVHAIIMQACRAAGVATTNRNNKKERPTARRTSCESPDAGPLLPDIPCEISLAVLPWRDIYTYIAVVAPGVFQAAVHTSSPIGMSRVTLSVRPGLRPHPRWGIGVFGSTVPQRCAALSAPVLLGSPPPLAPPLPPESRDIAGFSLCPMFR